MENLLPPSSKVDAWIGLAELSTDNAFSWTDNSVISFKNWVKDPGTRLNRGSMECIAMLLG